MLYGRVRLGGEEVIWEMGAIDVEGWERVFRPPAPAHAADFLFGDEIRVSGYEIGELKAGTLLRVTLCWQALREMAISCISSAPTGLWSLRRTLFPVTGVPPPRGGLPGSSYAPVMSYRSRWISPRGLIPCLQGATTT